MSNFFIFLFEFFAKRKALMYIIVIALFVVMAFFSAKIDFKEDITNFFPDGNKNASIVFDNLKVKDKIIVMVAAKGADKDRLVECADQLADSLNDRLDGSLIRNVTSVVDENKMTEVKDFIFNHLPIFLTEEDYSHLEESLSAQAIDSVIRAGYNKLISPIGSFLQDYIVTDPFGLSNNTLAELQTLNKGTDYQLYDGHIFNSEMNMCLLFIDPMQGLGDANKNERLVTQLEEVIDEMNASPLFEDVSVSYFGGAAVAVYNARQIKFDTIVTLNIALLLIVVFITLAFRNKWAVVLIILPVLFGALFAFFLIYFLKGSMSSIAAGAGAAVFGIALSYSIHVLSHSNHAKSRQEIIKELAYPLTIGSFTTIGAFLSLLFTSSQLLRDFGLFSALTLIGTTLFSLIFLPHFIKIEPDAKSSRLLKAIERLSDYRFDRNRWFVGIVAVVTLTSLFFYNKVEFNSDMMELNFEPKHLKEAELKLSDNNRENAQTVLFIAADKNPQEAIKAYKRLITHLKTFREGGEIDSYAAIDGFVVEESVQRERIERWEQFWTPERVQEVYENVERSALNYGFKKGSFDKFKQLMIRDYTPYDYTSGECSLFDDWINSSDSLLLFLSNVEISNAQKQSVYAAVNNDLSIVAADRSYYLNRMAEDVSTNFYLILFITSFIIFGALLISYGRIELTMMSFLPMMISWVIILGLMYLFGIEFNIVNIILSTFIFGIGDDFSIFIMDGILHEYRTGRKMLSAHKTAIFFSAVTTIVGMGSLFFAGHPALKSISLISILGMISVLLVAYTIQPIVFRLFVSNQTKNGGFPYTFFGLLNTIYAFGLFLLGCLLLQIFMGLTHLIPLGRKRRKELFHRAVSWSTHAFLRMMVTTKMVNLNPLKETFEEPAVIIANHQSFIDILLLLGLYPKLVMVTNSWVWKSPFFGRIVRYADFYHTADGYEELADTLKQKVEDGYSVIVFPEGTRSKNLEIGRFHKGAFYLAEKLNLDILPIAIYGTGLVSSKKQPLYIKKGFLVSKILKRIKSSDLSYGCGYKERGRAIRKQFVADYDQLYDEFNTARNHYFYDALIKNYTYKGPVLEWYMRIKVRMERNYRLFDEIIPRDASIVDVGCGYGPLAYMLSMLSSRRQVLGIDYDEEKIEVALHSFSKNERIHFVCADATTYDLPAADVYVMNDLLHYLPFESQEQLIRRAIERVRIGGLVILRDGDSDKKENHRVTELSEKWSTDIIGFNKTAGRLHFTSAEKIGSILAEYDVDVKIVENDKKTSNTIFIITKKS